MSNHAPQVVSPILGSAAAPVLEQLEPRRLLSAGVANKVLNIAGTTKADTLTLSFASGKVTVRLNSSAPQSFKSSTFQTINIAMLAGNDTVNMPSNLPTTVLFTTIDVGDGNDTVNGSNLNDNIIGGNGNDSLTGNAGDDTLMGQAGDDLLNGGAGNKDRVYPGLGNDTCSGGAGNYDTLTYQDRNDGVTVRIDGGGSVGNLKTSERDKIANDFENAVGGNGNDLVVGNAGNNVIGGAKGNDTLNPGAGNDSVWGDQGIDTLTYASRTTAVKVILSDSADTRKFGSETGAGGNDQLNTIENVIGGSGNDSIVGDGHNNVLTGGAGNDTLVGGKGNDTFDGGAGKDRVDGGVGTDTSKKDTNDVITSIESLK